MAKAPAWFVAWSCGCFAARVDRADVPATCPGHGREEIVEPELLQVLTFMVGRVHVRHCQCSASHVDERCGDFEAGAA